MRVVRETAVLRDTGCCAPGVWPCAHACACPARKGRGSIGAAWVGPLHKESVGWGTPPSHSPRAAVRAGRRATRFPARQRDGSGAGFGNREPAGPHARSSYAAVPDGAPAILCRGPFAPARTWAFRRGVRAARKVPRRAVRCAAPDRPPAAGCRGRPSAGAARRSGAPAGCRVPARPDADRCAGGRSPHGRRPGTRSAGATGDRVPPLSLLCSACATGPCALRARPVRIAWGYRARPCCLRYAVRSGLPGGVSGKVPPDCRSRSYLAE
ncbi:hypothetical protein SAMN05421870_102557 [Streptomyces qinglanensis]|uniref:Uncharacterized protein n=1 Tax=Streptomyces qinglanensis TaxID=943816 RepID=A0A1H9Q9Z2_9ACTN|nr:hypothetical protein SAMN05421870_102557 [Streptomyces qinglanensis]